MAKYLDLTGLTYFTLKIKNLINGKSNPITSSDNSITIDTTTDTSKVDLGINVDGVTILKNSNGSLSVKVLDTEKVLVSAEDGLRTSIILKKLDTPSSANILEEYILAGVDDIQLGTESIKIYKDSALVNFYLGHVDDTLSGENTTTHESSSSTVVKGTGDPALVYIMLLANGNYKLASVNVQSFLQESEFKDGLQVNPSTHEVSVKIDSDSESYLGFGGGENPGLKLTGVDSAISTAINNLGSTSAGSKKYLASISVSNGVLTSTTGSVPSLAKGTDGEYFTTTVSGSSAYKVSGSLTMLDISTASSSAKGLAEASDVKSYVDGLMGNITSISNTEIDNLF